MLILTMYILTYSISKRLLLTTYLLTYGIPKYIQYDATVLTLMDNQLLNRLIAYINSSMMSAFMDIMWSWLLGFLMCWGMWDDNQNRLVSVSNSMGLDVHKLLNV